MSNTYFRFRQFTINQDKAAMKVGTDAVLLGAWAKTKNAKRILDIGTGTGVIALMLAQKSNAIIDAIEIDEISFLQAKENIENSKWADRINVFLISLQSYRKKCSLKYDIIVSNPPYFVNSLKPLSESRIKARHNDSLSFDELLSCSKDLICQNGSFYIIIPYSENKNVIAIAKKNNFYCNEILKIKPSHNNNEARRVILKFEFVKKKLIENFLAIENAERHNYTDEYKILTKDFYLKI